LDADLARERRKYVNAQKQKELFEIFEKV